MNNADMKVYTYKAQSTITKKWVTGWLSYNETTDIYYIIYSDSDNKVNEPIDISTICRCSGVMVEGECIYENDKLKIVFDEDSVNVPVKYGIYSQSPYDKEETNCGFYLDWENADVINSYTSSLRKDLVYWLGKEDVSLVRSVD